MMIATPPSTDCARCQMPDTDGSGSNIFISVYCLLNFLLFVILFIVVLIIVFIITTCIICIICNDDVEYSD